MTTLDMANLASADAHRKRIKASLACEQANIEFKEVESKLQIAQKRLSEAEEVAYFADADVHIAICNSVADDRITRDALRDRIRGALYLRTEYKPNRSKKVVTYEDHIIEMLESAQIFSGGFRSIPEIRCVHLNVRGSSIQRDLTDKQRDRIMAVIDKYCPRRPDDAHASEGIEGGANLKGYATPYQIERYDRYKVRALNSE